MERINKELKQRTSVAGVFVNNDSLFIRAGSILMDVNRE